MLRRDQAEIGGDEGREILDIIAQRARRAPVQNALGRERLVARAEQIIRI